MYNYRICNYDVRWFPMVSVHGNTVQCNDTVDTLPPPLTVIPVYQEREPIHQRHGYQCIGEGVSGRRGFGQGSRIAVHTSELAVGNNYISYRTAGYFSRNKLIFLTTDLILAHLK